MPGICRSRFTFHCCTYGVFGSVATAFRFAPVTGKTAGSSTNSTAATNSIAGDRKSKEAAKPVEVVFAVKNDHAKMVPVKIGICDDNYWEIIDGLTNDQEIVSGGYRAIGRDLKDGSKIHVGPAGADIEAEKK